MLPMSVQPKAEPLRRVVIADADDDTRLMYREALRGLPLEIVEAGDGRDALVQCLLERPALLVVDTHMPSVTGYELCQIVRSDRQTQSVPILVVTSESGPIELTRLRLLGATTVIVKPVAIDSFVSTVAELCHGATEPAPGSTDSASSDAPPEAEVLRSASRNYRRFETTQPPAPPPALRCRACDVALEYRKSRIGGVSRREPEQWDEFRCPQCTVTFEYRHRTRSLRVV